MVKLLIVDDDEIICRGLATCIDWEANGIRVMDTVYDGELAWQAVQRNPPDIMLVDINMPFMDGLELSYAVRQTYPHIKILLLTAYKEFDYAKRALQLQVFDYLSKPFRNEDVLNAVLRAKETVELERHRIQALGENHSVLGRKYLSQIVAGTSVDPEKLRFCGLEASGVYYQVAVLLVRCILPEGQQDAQQALLKEELAQQVALDAAEQVFHGREDVLWFTRDDRVVFVLRQSGAGNDAMTELDCGQLLQAIARYDDYFASIGLGMPCEGAAQLPGSFAQAQRALEYHYAFSNNSIIHIDAVEKRSGQNRQALLLYQEALLRAVRQGDEQAARETVANLFDSLRQDGQMHLSAILFLSVEILSAAIRAADDESLYDSFVSECMGDFSALLRSQDIGDIQRLVERGIETLFAANPGQSRDVLHVLAGQAAAFIEENYENPALSLKMVADHVHISSSYLCILFRQFLHTSYVSYLNRTRMEQAKKLLRQSGIKTYEVAFKVGYNSSQYFASSFKKYTGLTPGEYRSGTKSRAQEDKDHA